MCKAINRNYQVHLLMDLDSELADVMDSGQPRIVSCPLDGVLPNVDAKHSRGASPCKLNRLQSVSATEVQDRLALCLGEHGIAQQSGQFSIFRVENLGALGNRFDSLEDSILKFG